MSTPLFTLDALHCIYEAVPMSVRCAVGSFLERYIGRFKQFLNPFVPEVVLLEGVEKNSGVAMSVVLAGLTAADQEYWARTVFARGAQRRSLGRCMFWQTDALIESLPAECHFAVKQDNAITRWLSRGADFYIPQWMALEVDLSEGREKVLSEREEEILQDIKKLRLSYQLTREEVHFEEFYEQMYVPSMRDLHTATVESYPVLFSIFTRGELMLIREASGAVLGGVLFDVEGCKGYCRAFGVRCGYADPVRNSVTAAAYYFLMEDLRKRGCKKLHLGPVRALLFDMATRSKTSLKSQLALRQPYPLWALTILKESLGVKTFMARNPFVCFEKNERVYRAVFFQQSDAADDDINRVVRRAVCHVLSDTYVFVYGPVTERVNYFFSVKSASPLFDHLLPAIPRKQLKVSSLKKFLRRFSLAGESTLVP